MSRFFTPAPPRVTRAGTFDGMEKLFFENAAAIETGEMTSPPEALSVPATPIQGGLQKLQGLSLFHKVGLGLAGSVLIAGAVLVFGGGSKSNASATPAAVAAPLAQPTLAVAAAPVVAEPATVVAKPPVVARKHVAAKARRAIPPRGKRVASVSVKKKPAARTAAVRAR
jgi:hypothetical protein